jgi:hypothetical protein
VLAAVRAVNRLESVGETLRATLNALVSTAERNGRAATEQKRRTDRSGPGLPGCCAAQLGGGLTGVRGERWRFLLCARR